MGREAIVGHMGYHVMDQVLRNLLKVTYNESLIMVGLQGYEGNVVVCTYLFVCISSQRSDKVEAFKFWG